MRLSQTELALVTRVRDMMVEDFKAGTSHYRKYICHNLLMLEKGWDELPQCVFSDCLELHGEVSRNIVSAINKHIRNHSSFEFFLEGRGMSWDEAVQAAPMARIEFLNKVVETGEIA